MSGRSVYIEPKKDTWYVVEITNPRYPLAFRYEFESEAEAKRAVKQLRQRPGKFRCLTGAGLLEYNIPIRKSKRFRWIKYDYPLSAYESLKKKKWYRSNTRRKLQELKPEILKKRYPELNRLL